MQCGAAAPLAPALPPPVLVADCRQLQVAEGWQGLFCGDVALLHQSAASALTWWTPEPTLKQRIAGFPGLRPHLSRHLLGDVHHFQQQAQLEI